MTLIVRSSGGNAGPMSIGELQGVPRRGGHRQGLSTLPTCRHAHTSFDIKDLTVNFRPSPEVGDNCAPVENSRPSLTPPSGARYIGELSPS
jgi:hypothetical protein